MWLLFGCSIFAFMTLGFGGGLFACLCLLFGGGVVIKGDHKTTVTGVCFLLS